MGHGSPQSSSYMAVELWWVIWSHRKGSRFHEHFQVLQVFESERLQPFIWNRCKRSTPFCAYHRGTCAIPEVYEWIFANSAAFLFEDPGWEKAIHLCPGMDRNQTGIGTCTHSRILSSHELGSSLSQKSSILWQQKQTAGWSHLFIKANAYEVFKLAHTSHACKWFYIRVYDSKMQLCLQGPSWCNGIIYFWDSWGMELLLTALVCKQAVLGKQRIFSSFLSDSRGFMKYLLCCLEKDIPIYHQATW